MSKKQREDCVQQLRDLPVPRDEEHKEQLDDTDEGLLALPSMIDANVDALLADTDQFAIFYAPFDYPEDSGHSPSSDQRLLSRCLTAQERIADTQANRFDCPRQDTYVSNPILSTPTPSHRTRNVSPLFPACVARPVSRPEMQASKPAMDACDREWKRLQDKGVWDIRTVREWRDVAREARDADEQIHMGRWFGLCV